jgi:hypothetical protein
VRDFVGDAEVAKQDSFLFVRKGEFKKVQKHNCDDDDSS